jgi:deoxyadenosine/deoxycytidine kinase
MSEAVPKLKLSLEGNIAAGKSTFLKILSEQVDLLCVPEPVNKWQNVGPEKLNLLEMFYSDPSRYAYLFQTYAFLSRMRSQLHPYDILEKDENNYKLSSNSVSDSSEKTIKENKREKIIMFERSVLSDKYCFAMNCFESGLLNKAEFEVYKDFHSFLVEEFNMLRLNGIIYLRTTPETCSKRLEKRSRSEEKTVSIDYLRSIHEKHEEWLLNPELNKLPTLVIDCDDEFESDPVVCESMKVKVASFLKEIKLF